MLKLPTNAGEWGFVVVLSILFCGLSFAVIYSQVVLHDIKKEQAVRDTETTLRLLASRVRLYQREHGRIEDTLTAMGIEQEELETRHATFENQLLTDGKTITLKATLLKFSSASCTLTSTSGSEDPEISWSGT